jgi:hypothetical protein
MSDGLAIKSIGEAMSSIRTEQGTKERIDQIELDLNRKGYTRAASSKSLEAGQYYRTNYSGDDAGFGQSTKSTITWFPVA